MLLRRFGFRQATGFCVRSLSFYDCFYFAVLFYSFAESCNRRKDDALRRNSVAGMRDDSQTTGEGLIRAASEIKILFSHYNISTKNLQYPKSPFLGRSSTFRQNITGFSNSAKNG